MVAMHYTNILTLMRPLFVSVFSVKLKLTYFFVLPIQYNNREAVAQELYDAITKRAAVLGQLASGLFTLGFHEAVSTVFCHLLHCQVMMN